MRSAAARCYNLAASVGALIASSMVGKILLPEIQSLIEARDFTALREIFSEMPPADVAEIILDLPEDEQVIIFRVLPHALAADVFEYLDVESRRSNNCSAPWPTNRSSRF